MEKIISISLKLNFIPNTLGCFGLSLIPRGLSLSNSTYHLIIDSMKEGLGPSYADSYFAQLNQSPMVSSKYLILLYLLHSLRSGAVRRPTETQGPGRSWAEVRYWRLLAEAVRISGLASSAPGTAAPSDGYYEEHPRPGGSCSPEATARPPETIHRKYHNIAKKKTSHITRNVQAVNASVT